jgi:hypothetical protein
VPYFFLCVAVQQQQQKKKKKEKKEIWFWRFCGWLYAQKLCVPFFLEKGFGVFVLGSKLKN